MRTAMKVTIQCRLLAIPGRVGTAMDARKSLFHHTHRACSTRIETRRWCPGCEAEVPDFSDPDNGVGKGIELADKSMVLVTDDELDELRLWDNKTVKLLQFTQESEVDDRLYDQTYYFEPDTGGAPAHALLMAAMQTTPGLVAICQVGYRERLALGMMRVRDGIFEIITLRWPAELRTQDVKLPRIQPPRPNEVKMAVQLVKSMTKPFDPAEHVDEYSARLVEFVTAKADGGAPAGRPAKADPAQPYADMMGLLQASIDAQKQIAKPAPRRRTAKAS
jgi:DNA end-binding protein Ku